MGIAKNRIRKSDAIASDAAPKPTTKTPKSKTPKPKTPTPTPTPTPKTGAKNPLASMNDAQTAALHDTLQAFRGVGVAEWMCAEAVGVMISTGAHTANGYSDFAQWLSDASEGVITRSAAGRYAQASQTLAHCECDAEAKASARLVSIDTLAKIAGHARKSAKTPDGRASKARMAVKAYRNARAEGKTAPQSAEIAGFGKSASAPDTLDRDAQVQRIVSLALNYAKSTTGSEGDFATADALLRGALERLAKMRETAAKVASA